MHHYFLKDAALPNAMLLALRDALLSKHSKGEQNSCYYGNFLPFVCNVKLGHESDCMEESFMIWKFLSSRIDRILRIWFRTFLRYSNLAFPTLILLKDRAQILYSKDIIPFIVLWKYKIILDICLALVNCKVSFF